MKFNIDYSELYYVKSADGEEVMALKILPPPSTYKGRICILFSSSKLAVGTECTLYSGGSLTGGADFHGLYTGTDYYPRRFGYCSRNIQGSKICLYSPKIDSTANSIKTIVWQANKGWRYKVIVITPSFLQAYFC